MSSGRPQAPGTVPAVAAVPYQIAGPMGRAYLTLPCGHQQASVADPYTVTAPPRPRTCRTCGLRYQITIRTGTGIAQVMRLT